MNKISISQEQLEELYTNKKFSTAKIASIFNCSPSAIFYKLQRNGVPLRKKKIVFIDKKSLADLYLIQKLSMSKIAQQYSCCPTVVFDLIRKYRIPTRSANDKVYLKIAKMPFEGDSREKAYLIGFRLGDLYAREGLNSVYVKTNTTKQEQVRLMRSLFHRYGKLNIRRGQKDINMDIWLDKSFAFLAPKQDEIPKWIVSDEGFFMAFIAGYTDAEGSMGIYSRRARFRLGSYDINILRSIHEFFLKKGIISYLRLETFAGTRNQNNDFWRVSVHDMHSLKNLLEMLEPLLRHPKRRKDLKAALLNVKQRIGDLNDQKNILHNYCH